MTSQIKHPAARQDFQDDGYVFLQGFLGESDIAEIHANLTRFIGDCCL